MRSMLLSALALVALLGVSGCLGHSKEERLIERGRYLVEIMGCNDCHTPGYLTRGTYIPEDEWLVGDHLGYHGDWGTAYPTNLRLLLNDLSEDAWMAMAKRMRKNSPMAWVMLPRATDTDLVAIYRFVRHLGPRGEPVPARLAPGVTPQGPVINFPAPH